MARPIWSGSVSFGLVNIPVKLFSAVSRKTVRFNQIEASTGARIKQKRVSSVSGEEVDYSEIVKGYELPTGEFVTIASDELDSLDPEAVRTIDLQEFVDLVDIDPIFYDSPYYLAPNPDTQKPYKLLATAMEEAGKVGIAKFVMRSKQYLAAIRSVDGHLLLSTMVYADEIVAPSAVDLFSGLDEVDVTEGELGMARQLIASLEADFAPEKFTDTYRLAVLDLIDRKVAGEETIITASADQEMGSVVDLMAALEASVAEAKKARSRHPTSGGAEVDDPEVKRTKKAVANKPAKTAGTKTPAKKASAKSKATKKKAAIKKAS